MRTLALLGLATLACAARQPTGDDDGSSTLAPPNVVMIVADDQAYGDFGFMGHPVVRTPRLDAFAAESFVYTRGYVTAPICRPSLGSLVTGLHPHQSKITSTSVRWPKGLEWSDEEVRVARDTATRMREHIDSVPTLPRLLARRGYRSFQSGKWWEGSYARGGFTDGMTLGDPDHHHPHGDAGLRIGRDTMEPLFEFIDESDEEPFFVWFAPMLPHIPHDPPEELLAYYRDKTDSIHVARYWAMCERFDRACGELLDGLEERGLSEDTLVLFLSDNGWIQNPHDALGDPLSKGSPLEGGVRTPIVLRWPGKVAPGSDTDHAVSAIDVPATIAEVAGLGGTLPGVNLLSPRAVSERGPVFGANYSYRVRDPNQPLRNLDWIYAVEGRWKLLVPAKTYVQPNKPALFDLDADPGEQHDLAQTHPAVHDRLRASIDAWWPAGGAASRR